MKKVHKIAIVLITILAIIIGLTYTTFAVTGKINVDRVRLRESASTDSNILTRVTSGEEVEILGEENGWYKVSYKGQEGYIYKDYVEAQQPAQTPVATQPTPETSPEPTPSPEPSVEPTPEPSPDVQETPQTTEIGDTLNKDTSVYLLPNYTAIKINNLKQNQKVKVITTLANWAKIEANNQRSWVPKTVLMKDATIEQPTEPEPQAPAETTINKAGYISSDTSVNFRQGPSTDAASNGKIDRLGKVTVISEINDWYKISYNGQEGYVAKRLVTLGEPPAEDTSSRSGINRHESAPAPSANASTVAEIAKQYVGCSYVYGGNSPAGFDCSGFTSYVYSQAGISVGRTTYQQAAEGSPVSRSELQPGDLIVFSGTGHVGIYIGDGQIIHAVNPNTGVVYDSIDYGYWAGQYQSARRF